MGTSRLSSLGLPSISGLSYDDALLNRLNLKYNGESALSYSWILLLRRTFLSNQDHQGAGSRLGGSHQERMSLIVWVGSPFPHLKLGSQ